MPATERHPLCSRGAVTATSIDKPTVTPTLVRQLRELADTPFVVAAYRARWESYGWVHQPESADRFGFGVSVNEDCVFRVDPLGDQVVCAYLPIYYWEKYERGWHHDGSEYDRQLAAYNAAFGTAAHVARAVLPTLGVEWTDTDASQYKAIIWQGTRGLLILQQAAFDVQFGVEVNFWLTPCQPEAFRPTTPLIDWLCRVSQLRHDTGGFPPPSA